MSVDTQISNDALSAANQMINVIMPGNASTLLDAKAIANSFYEPRKRSKNSFIPHNLIAVGNCHIDTCWLWPYDETKRKVARSWSTQCRLLEQNPEYTFAASQM